MVNSSFQTENLQVCQQPQGTMAVRMRAYCWMYFGRHDSRYWPYLWRASPFSENLSAGLTMGAFRGPGSARCAC